MRPEVFDEPHHARGVSDRDVFRFPENGLVEDHRVRGFSQFLVLAEPGDAHEDVAVIAGDERRIDAQVSGDRGFGPAGGERAPRFFQTFEREVPEIGLQ